MAHTGTKIIQAANLARSAIAPLTSAAVMIAKLSWKVEKSSSGTEPCTVSGPIPAMPMCDRSPITPPKLDPENANV